MTKVANKESLGKTKYAEYIRDVTALGNPFILLLVTFVLIGTHQHFWQLLAIMVVGFLINEVLCSGIKYLWHKPRPNGQQFENALEKIDAGSFPSIHAARISFVYLTLGYIQYQLDAWYYLPIFALVIILVGYSRVFLHKHFPLDVAAGYTFGSVMFGIVSLIIP
ncbi:MAG: phosphatase PAP2 family protein [Aureispira sp.]|nr:phosphatase PAP2 family protein [Aureispira sp.]